MNRENICLEAIFLSKISSIQGAVAVVALAGQYEWKSATSVVPLVESAGQFDGTLYLRWPYT